MPVRHDHPLDDDPAQLLQAPRGGDSDRVRQGEDPRAIGIKGPDPVAVRQFGERHAGRIPLRLVFGVGKIAPAVLRLEPLEPCQEPLALATGQGYVRSLEPSTQLGACQLDDL